MNDYGNVACSECGARLSHHAPDYDQAAGSRAWRGCPPDLWTVVEGRNLAFDGVRLLYIEGLSDERRGLLYYPAELDTLTHEIATALNAQRVDGSRVARG